MRFDFLNKRLILYSGEDREAQLKGDSFSQIDASFNQYGIDVDAQINGQKIKLIFDTGATVTITKANDTSMFNEADKCSKKHADITDPTCFIGTYSLSKSEKTYPIIVWNNALENYDGDGLIGFDTMSEDVFLINFVGKQLYVAKP